MGAFLAAVAVGSRSALPPPVLRAHPGWIVVRPGPSQPSMTRRMVVAVTARDVEAVRPFAPFTGFKRLRPNGILVWATTMGHGPHGPTANFPRGAWPPALSSFRVDRGWEGQPAANVQQRLRFMTTHGWHLDVRVYFATQHPSRALLARAQAELNRLGLPRAR